MDKSTVYQYKHSTGVDNDPGPDGQCEDNALGEKTAKCQSSIIDVSSMLSELLPSNTEISATIKQDVPQSVLPPELRKILDSALVSSPVSPKLSVKQTDLLSSQEEKTQSPCETTFTKNTSETINKAKHSETYRQCVQILQSAPKKALPEEDDPVVKVVAQKPRRKKAKNIFTRIDDLQEGPLFLLKIALIERRKIKVWIRSAVHVRSICSGFVQLFDKHMNLAMSDVDEIFINPLFTQRREIRVLPKKKKKKRSSVRNWDALNTGSETSQQPDGYCDSFGHGNQQVFIQTNFAEEDDQLHDSQLWALRGVSEMDENLVDMNGGGITGDTKDADKADEIFLKGPRDTGEAECVHPIEEMCKIPPGADMNPAMNLDGKFDDSSDENPQNQSEDVKDLDEEDLEALAAKLKLELAECSESSEQQTIDSPVKHSTKHKHKHHHKEKSRKENDGDSKVKGTSTYISTRDKDGRDSDHDTENITSTSSAHHKRTDHSKDRYISPDYSHSRDQARHKESYHHQSRSGDSEKKHNFSDSPERSRHRDKGMESGYKHSEKFSYSSSSHQSVHEESRERRSRTSSERNPDYPEEIHVRSSHSSHSNSREYGDAKSSRRDRCSESQGSRIRNESYSSIHSRHGSSAKKPESSRSESRSKSVSTNDLRQKLLKRSIKYSRDADRERVRSSKLDDEERKRSPSSQERGESSKHTKIKSTHEQTQTAASLKQNRGDKSKQTAHGKDYSKSSSRSRSKEKILSTKDLADSRSSGKFNEYEYGDSQRSDKYSENRKDKGSRKKDVHAKGKSYGKVSEDRSKQIGPVENATEKEIIAEMDMHSGKSTSRKDTLNVDHEQSKSTPDILRRYISQLFIRGDNIVMVAFAN